MTHPAIRVAKHDPCPFCGCPPPAASARRPRAVPPADCDMIARLCQRWDHYHAGMFPPYPVSGPRSGYAPAFLRGTRVDPYHLDDYRAALAQQNARDAAATAAEEVPAA